MADLPRVAYTVLQSWHRVPGGTATSALRLGEALVATGEIDLVGVGPRGAPPPAPWTPSFPVRRLPLPYPAVYEVWHRWRRLPVQRATGAVDLVHATAPTVPPAGGAPLVVTVHDVFPLTDPERFTPRGVRLLTRGLELARDEAALVLCPSQATADECAAHGFDRATLRVVPWGVSVRRPEDARIDAALRRHGLRAGGYLLAVGTVEPRKNLRTLIAAVARTARADVPLAVVGPDGWNEDLEPVVAAAGERVRRLGFVSDDDLAALEAGALALCVPSLREGFGMSVLDAMSLGTPVVTSTDVALREVAGDAGLAVEALDVDGWVAALDELVGDDDRRRELGRRGVARATHRTWAATASATLAAYRELW